MNALLQPAIINFGIVCFRCQMRPRTQANAFLKMNMRNVPVPARNKKNSGSACASPFPGMYSLGPRPALIREPENSTQGLAFEVEVWEVPIEQFG